MKVFLGVLLIAVGIVVLVATIFSPFTTSKESNGREVIADLTSIETIDFSSTSVDWNIQSSNSDMLIVELSNEARQIDLVSKEKNGTLQIEVKEPRFKLFSFNFHGSTKATVFIPNHYTEHLTVNSVSGDVAFSDEFTYGNVLVKTVSGDVKGTTLSTSETEVATTSGDIDIERLSAKNSKTTSVSGDLYIGEMSGEVDGKTVSGDIYIGYENENEKTTLKTVSGDVELSIPLANAELSVNTISGNLRVEAELRDQTIQSKSITGKIGEGLHQMTISTTSGDVRIR